MTAAARAGVRAYAAVTGAYWGFTLTDGALRMLVLLHFNALGYSPVELALLFVLYEACGVVTNLVGGWVATRFGLRATLWSGLALQIGALLMLASLDPAWGREAGVIWAVLAQGLAGIAKDLTKMSAKSAIKAVVPDDPASGGGLLFRWVALLTGSKNALKGVGFFLGGALLGGLGFQGGLVVMAAGLGVVLMAALVAVPAGLGGRARKAPFRGIFARNPAVNLLSAARLFLFGARDVWFVVGLPVFLHDGLGWSFARTGGFMAVWTIGYGIVQASAPALVRRRGAPVAGDPAVGDPVARDAARIWAAVLAVIPAAMAAALAGDPTLDMAAWIVVGGLLAFGVVFAINSAVHSYLILAYAEGDRIALNVGFYYMANAMGRLVGTLASGLLFAAGGLALCLAGSAVMVALSFLIALALPVPPAADPTAPLQDLPE
ncbi:MFS transporter permease [Tistrella bauzanensis]|uniref:MFS transporter permease n=1 Tax=Tistrella bauzanensis TaxID=657419 RepID=A0ABQ1ILD7_9PROT|nr:organoarsenical effux MFS transporter ArsJ [Tistrella bauzanensis]GGB46337.1 MFS transporter permease [Tistrella bauzanensis]